MTQRVAADKNSAGLLATGYPSIFALTIASLLIGCNWLLYVLATTSGHTLDASLGYFMNPLVSVLLGVIF